MIENLQFGLYIPNFGDELTPARFVELAQIAKAAGWDGFFLWDHILHYKTTSVAMVDPRVVLGSIAITTQRIRIGTMVTPIARRRPSKLARETVTLDHLSSGRLTLGVGLGHPPDVEFEFFGEESDDRTRAEKLDEGLEILSRLWRGEPFEFNGKHHVVKRSTFLPPSHQQPRIPVWVAGRWPIKAPFRRAARWDGVVPLMQRGLVKPETLPEIIDFIQQHRQADTRFDVAPIGTTPADKPKQAIKKILPFAENGVTWWFESLYSSRDSWAQLKQRVGAGPPHLQ